MRFKKFLHEDYVTLGYSGTPIFVNPSLKEMRDAGTEYRFFIDVRNNYLNEEYEFRYQDAEVFKNPNKSDILFLSKERRDGQVRFAMVPETKNVYVWCATHAFFHWMLADQKFTEVTRENSLFGYGHVKAGKIHVVSKDSIRFGDDGCTEFSPEELKWAMSLKLFQWEKDLFKGSD
jgi:hypothetical protein